MAPELTVSNSFLLRGTEFLQISHHEKFQSVGGLHPRTGILLNPVHIQQRSSLGSLAQVCVSYFLECAPKLDNQRLLRCEMFGFSLDQSSFGVL